MCGLAAVHLPAHHPLGILHRQAALGVGDKHDEHNQSQQADDDHRDDPGGQGGGVNILLGLLHAGEGGGILLRQRLSGNGAVAHIVPHGYAVDGVHNHLGEAGDDTGKQDHGDAVADAELGNLLAQPHQERGAGGEGQDNHHAHPDGIQGAAIHQAIAVNQGVVTKALQQADGNGGIAGDGGNLLPAFLAALLGHPLQRGDSHREQLDDNGAVDIGLDAQSEDSGHGEGGAAHGVHQTQNGAALHLQIGLQRLGVDIGDRNGGAQPENQQGKDGEENLTAQLRHRPRIADCLNHTQTTST